MLLGTFLFNNGGSGYKVELADNGKVAADSIDYVRDTAPVDSFTWTPTIPANGSYQRYARCESSESDPIS